MGSGAHKLTICSYCILYCMASRNTVLSSPPEFKASNFKVIVLAVAVNEAEVRGCQLVLVTVCSASISVESM